MCVRGRQQEAGETEARVLYGVASIGRIDQTADD